MDAMLERDVGHVHGVASASGQLREQAQALQDAIAVCLVRRGWWAAIAWQAGFAARSVAKVLISHDR